MEKMVRRVGRHAFLYAVGAARREMEFSEDLVVVVWDFYAESRGDCQKTKILTGIYTDSIQCRIIQKDIM